MASMLNANTLKQKLSYLILGQRGGQTRIQIIRAIVERPYNLNQLAEMLDLNYRTIKHHVDLLLKNELINTSRSGGYGEVYFISPDLEANMAIFEEVCTKLTTITTSPKFFQNVIEQTNDAVIIIDCNLETLFWNDSAEELYGYTRAAVIGKRIPIFPDIATLKGILKMLEEGKKVIGFETVALHGSGKKLEVDVTVDSIRDETGKLVGYSIISMDITERKRTMEALRLSEERYSLAQRAAQIGSWDWNIVTDELGWSDNIEPMFGFGPGEFKRTFQAFLKCVHPDDRDAVEKAVNAAVKKSSDYAIEHRIVWPDGTVRLLSETGGCIKDEKGKAVRMLGIVQDITDRVEVEKKYGLIIRNAPIGFWTNDMKGRLTEVNPAYCKMVGYSRKELLSMSITDLEATEKPGETARHIKKVLEEGSDTFETRHRRKDGTILDMEINAIYLNIAGGRLVVFIQDITERKRAEADLRETNEYLDNLFNYANAPIIVWDPQFRITRFNRAFEKLTGRKADEVNGKTMEILFPPDKVGKTMDFIRKTHGVERWKTVEIDIQHVDGNVRTVLWNSASILGNDRRTHVATIAQGQDITDRKAAEERIRHLASFPEMNPNPVLEIGPDGTPTFVNEAAERALREAHKSGRTEQFLPRSPRDILAELERKKDRSIAGEVTVGEKEYSVIIYKVPGLDLLRVYAWDTTERRRALEALRESRDNLDARVKDRTAELERINLMLQETLAAQKKDKEALNAERQRLSDALEKLPAYLILLTPDYRVTFANRFFRERFGESRGRRCYEYLFGRKEPCGVCHTFEVLKNDAPLEWDWKGPDGRDYHIYDYPFKDVDGSKLILEVGIDVTAHQQTKK